MNNDKIVETGITFDDVLLIPGYSDLLPRDAQLGSKLTQKISLNLPILSAAMDTVTESNMAVAIAREGGLGVIHKNMSIKDQAEQVDLVKRSESGMINDPVTLRSNNIVKDALDLMAKFHISGFPIVDGNNKFIGIITNRDLRFQLDPQELILNAMTKDNLITAPFGTTLEEAEIILRVLSFLCRQPTPHVKEKGLPVWAAPSFVEGGRRELHHAAHTAHAAHVRHWWSSCLILFRCVRHHRFRGDQNARDRSSVLKRSAHNLGRVDDPGLDHIAIFFVLRIEAVG